MAKTYVGNGKKRSATWLKINLDVEKLLANAYTGKNGKKYINLDVNIKDAPDQYGKDVSVALDDYKPTEGNGSGRNTPPPPASSAPTAPAASSPASAGFNDDLPF